MEIRLDLSARASKVGVIFNEFDRNRDGRLNRQELVSLLLAVNPRFKFSEVQIEAILDEVYRTYGKFIDGDTTDWGLSFAGLLQTYEDGAGDVDTDLAALGYLPERSLKIPFGNFKELALRLSNADGGQADSTLSTLEVVLTHGESVFDCMTDLAQLVGFNTTLTHVEVSQDWGYASGADLGSERKVAMQSRVQERMAVESEVRGELERMLRNELQRNTTLQFLSVGSWKLGRVGDGHEWRMTYAGPCLARELGECLAEYYNVIVKR